MKTRSQTAPKPLKTVRLPPVKPRPKPPPPQPQPPPSRKKGQPLVDRRRPKKPPTAFFYFMCVYYLVPFLFVWICLVCQCVPWLALATR
jgi:hypothetical protein